MKKRLEIVHPIYNPDEWEVDPEVKRRYQENAKVDVGPNGELTITFHFPVSA